MSEAVTGNAKLFARIKEQDAEIAKLNAWKEQAMELYPALRLVPQPALSKVDCAGVGDNNGFFEIGGE